MVVNEQLAIDHGLKKDEYKKICDLLKRVPNITELGIFSAMWNEHCSYKSSRFHLKNLPTKGKNVIQGPGENAGVIDIGDNDAIIFKIESPPMGMILLQLAFTLLTYPIVIFVLHSILKVRHFEGSETVGRGMSMENI